MRIGSLTLGMKDETQDTPKQAGPQLTCRGKKAMGGQSVERNRSEGSLQNSMCAHGMVRNGCAPSLRPETISDLFPEGA